MPRHEKIALTIAAIVILAWCIFFGAWLMLTTWPPIFYYPN
jgi:hypothetical protein